MTLKGRHWVMFWLVVALGTFGSVTARQTSGFATGKQLREARDERSALEARRGELERRIRQASSRQVLVPRATEGLGLHEPSASEITVLAVPPDVAGGLPAELASPPPVRSPAAKPAPPKPRAAARAAARKPAPHRVPVRARPKPRPRGKRS